MQDHLDILFANRNKAYGAYVLRRSYDNYLGRALAIGLGAILLAVFVPRWLAAAHLWNKADQPYNVVTTLTRVTVETPPKEVIPPVAEPPKPTRATQAFIPPVVLPNDQVPEEPEHTAIEDLLQSPADIGATTQAGDPDALPEPGENPDAGTGILEGPAAPAPADATYEMFDVNVPPRYGSGDADLLAYLADNMQYPALARENNIQGSVVLTFVVDKDGRVKDVAIIKDIGGGCGKEAVRVLQNMPPWRPGEAAGHAVKVRFTLPVRFKLQ